MPTEQSLSRQFGVSRTVVREAISRLKSDGLVESRQGSGVSVVPASLRKSFKLHEALLGRTQVIALLELRQPLEMASARLAAERHTAEDLQEIVDAQERMKLSLDWSDEGCQADLDFHHAIAKATAILEGVKKKLGAREITGDNKICKVSACLLYTSPSPRD